MSCLTTVCEQIGQGVQRWQLGALRRCTEIRTPGGASVGRLAEARTAR